MTVTTYVFSISQQISELKKSESLGTFENNRPPHPSSLSTVISFQPPPSSSVVKDFNSLSNGE